MGRIAGPTPGHGRKTCLPIGLESEDGWVKMQFQRGSLQTYRFDTGERR